jgi:hypothetical protein
VGNFFIPPHVTADYGDESRAQGIEPLEAMGVRPRQVRYQAALRPDMTCRIDSKVLSNFVPPRNLDFRPRPCIYALNENRAF